MVNYLLKHISIIIFVVITSLVSFVCYSMKGENKTVCLRNQNENIVLATLDEDSNIILIDSLNVGEAGRFKLIARSIVDTTNFGYRIQINIFLKVNRLWNKVQQIDAKSEYEDPFIDLKDINGDGYGDLTFKSFISGRGANDLRYLYIFDQKSSKFTYLKDSKEISNLYFNQDLDSFKSHGFSGGSMTTFLH